MSKNLPEQTQTRQLTEYQKKFIPLLFECKTKQEAAKLAGYSDGTATHAFTQNIQSPVFQDALRQYAVDNNIGQLPIVAQIEAKIFKEVLKKPSKYKNYKEVFKQTKQIAGLLSQEDRPHTTIINIKSIGKVQVALTDIASKRLAEQS